jgi:hypothetical protein
LEVAVGLEAEGDEVLRTHKAGIGGDVGLLDGEIELELIVDRCGIQNLTGFD